ncbi:MAG: hypothetical protein HQL01_00170 [Nitrospirae bacterium]|nr:hypothetical protein [Nitrospirota bacterium]
MSRLTKILKQTLLYAFLVFVLTAFVELSSYVTYRMIYRSWMSYERLENERQYIIKSIHTAPDNKSISIAETFYLLHPYYGYVMNEGAGERFQNVFKANRNGHGFFGKSSPVQKRGADKLLVGITGGSVAAIMGVMSEDTLVKRLSEIPQFKGRQVILINLAQPAFKQPQQLLAASDIISQGGQFDIFIDIDGFNEITLPIAHDNLGQGVPFYFPQDWRVLTERKSSKKEDIAAARIELAKEHRRDTALMFTAWLPSHTATGNLLWKVMDSKDEQKKADHETALKTLVTSGGIREFRQVRSTQCRTSFLGQEQHYKMVRDLYIEIARHWQRNSILLNNLITSQGGMYFQFLQPNQYFPGSKPISAAEATVALSDSSIYKKEVERGYPYMRAGGAGLQKAGVNFTDLTLMFKDVKTPVYSDTCCHFSKEGYDFIVNSMADTIAKTVAAGGDRLKSVPIEQIETDTSAFTPDNLRRYTLDAKGYDDGSTTPVKQQQAVPGAQ